MTTWWWLPLQGTSQVCNHWSYDNLQFMSLPFSRSTQISREKKKNPDHGITCGILYILSQGKTAEFVGVISHKPGFFCSGIKSDKMKVVDRRLQVHKPFFWCPVVTFQKSSGRRNYLMLRTKEQPAGQKQNHLAWRLFLTQWNCSFLLKEVRVEKEQPYFKWRVAAGKV